MTKMHMPMCIILCSKIFFPYFYSTNSMVTIDVSMNLPLACYNTLSTFRIWFELRAILSLFPAASQGLFGALPAPPRRRRLLPFAPFQVARPLRNSLGGWRLPALGERASRRGAEPVPLPLGRAPSAPPVCVARTGRDEAVDAARAFDLLENRLGDLTSPSAELPAA